MRNIGLLTLLALLLAACSDVEITHQNQAEFKDLDFDYNDHELDLILDNDIVKLGRVLFYDNLLSLNGNVSCATCHKQELAFADDVALSKGFLDGLTVRNSQPLINTHFNKSFFWDSRTRNIQDAVAMPIFDTKEMGLNPQDLLKRINNSDYYMDLIENAFPGFTRESEGQITGLMTQTTVQHALAEFVSSIISTDSKFDASMRQATTEEVLSEEEQAGLELFDMHCNACHSALGDAIEIDGPVSTNPYVGLPDVGLVNIGLEPMDESSFQGVRFRIPTLRNIGSTAPYMHDGRFETLREVIDHYDDGVEGFRVDHRLLDEDGEIKKLELTDLEKDQLESFLLTLTDHKIETDKKWSDPFIR